VPPMRDVEERRFAAVTALKAMVECLRDTNPTGIFPSDKAGLIDNTKTQAITNRWADKASDVLVQSLELAERIGADALDMFDGSTHSRGAERTTAP
jgi:hypothetical protein